ncbi:MAG: SpoVG family protein [Oscillospiraceae bacterium]
MKLTDIKIRRTFTEGNLRAVVSITIDDCIAIHEVKVIQGSERLFVAMPSRRDENGIYRDIIHPITPGVRECFEKLILTAYNNYISTQNVLNSEVISA